jgi:hypothetical protein
MPFVVIGFLEDWGKSKSLELAKNYKGMYYLRCEGTLSKSDIAKIQEGWKEFRALNNIKDIPKIQDLKCFCVFNNKK